MSDDEDFCMDMSSDDEFVPAASKENVKKQANKKAPAARKPKAATKKASTKKVALSDSEDEEAYDDFDLDDDADVKKPAKKGSAGARRTSMERAQLSNKYQKKTQLEHIMLRPDTYIGSTEEVTTQMWVFDDEDGMQFRNVTYVPGLYKIFDEILVNASDNKQRDPNMRNIKVTINEDTGAISVWNDGRGIPVEIHSEHNVYIPELVFGHLMTGENFEDTEKRVVGGRNGYGAKLANIFSTEFSVETNDSKSGYRYKQTWTKNMSVKGEPTLKSASGKDFTCVTFTPDYARFGMSDGLDKDTISLLKKRVYDVAGVTDKSVKVSLDGTALKVSNFDQYIDLYLPKDVKEEAEANDDEEDDDYSDDDYGSGKKKKAAKKKTKSGPVRKIYERVNERWEICIAPSPDGQMQQVSFVNGICTMKGGQHVNFVADQVATLLQPFLKKKGKGSDFKPHQIKSQLWIFVNCLIENPAFDSQTKESLTTRHPKFGPKKFLPQISDKSIKQIEKTPIVDNILYWAKAKEMRELSRKAGGTKKSKIKDVDKLDDANNAGTRLSDKCTLILTEGDSAKTLAISGLSVVGRDNYGVFPLRGKLLNVREASHSQIMKNEEIQNIMKIMGLSPGKTYTDTKGLRYGHLMIMTDQDHDGSHIKGLLMNFIHHFWPSLLKIPGFLQVFITPIVKATSLTRRGESMPFYTLPEYEHWLESLAPVQRKRWKIKYYKGLGTSTAAEAKEYFAEIDRHRIDMEWEGDEGGDALDMAFSKRRVADRKDWLANFVPGTFMDFDVASIAYRKFVNEELILFSMADNVRSIPSMVDGFKPSQRKVLFSCFKRKLHSDIKVAQLVGYVSEHSAYHHGEVSLATTVVSMAQDFVGSNNINLLFPSGQFGSRLLGGKDAASSRYIFTRLANLTRKIYHAHDDALLSYLEEDGQSIEPTYYAPILPMVLVNGTSGIGTGWSTDIPCYNPRDLVEYLRRKMNCLEMDHKLQPWYKGFAGEISPEIHAKKGFTGRYKVCGVFERDDDREAIIISELPVSTWTQTYKQFLHDEKAFPEGFIKDIGQNHTDSTVLFTVFLSSEAYRQMKSDAALIKRFRLESYVNTNNMHAYGTDNMIRKYETPEQILDEFFDYRLDMYVKRKAHIEKTLETEWRKLDNKARFVKMVINDEIKIAKRKKKDLVAELHEKGFDQFHPPQKRSARNVADPEEDADAVSDEEQDPEAAGAPAGGTEILAKGYDYLLSMPLWNLTLEKVEQLYQQRDGKREELDVLRGKKPHNLWEEDLDALEEALDAQEEEDAKAAELEQNQRRGAGSRRGAKKAPAKKKAAPKKKKALMDLDSDDDLNDFIVEDDESDDDFALELKSKPEPKARATRKPAVKKKLAPKVKNEPETIPEPPAVLQIEEDEAEEEEEDEVILSLSERLKARMMVSPAPKPKPSKVPQAGEKRRKEATPVQPKSKPRAASKKVLLDSDDDEDFSDDDYSKDASTFEALTPTLAKPEGKKPRLKTAEKPKPAAKIAAKPAATKAKPATKAAATKAAAAKPAATKAAAAKPRAAAKKKSVYVELSESEEEFDEDDASSEEETTLTPVKPAPRRARATKTKAQKSLVEAVSDDDDFQLSSDEDQDDDDEDFSE